MEETFAKYINVDGELMDLSRPQVMGILNVTPDSFYADSRKQAEEDIVNRVHQIIEEGGRIIDIGAYSSRPDAEDVSPEEEMKRLKHGLQVIRREFPDAIVSADTFRAAAVEQLDIWGERVGVPVVKQKMGSDPASVAFDTVTSAKAHGADVVIIDTAGRLHNKKGLMDELTKIKNVMRRVVPDAPHEILLVLDGSTGQNAFEQARQFVAATEVNELAITKLDGTAKGGVVIGISDQFKIPVKYIGLGEGMEDLQVFRKEEFVRSLFGK